MTIEESRQSLNASVEYFSDDAPLVSGAAQCIVNMDALKTLLTAYAAQAADSTRLDALDGFAQRNGVIVTAGDNSFSVVASSIRTALDDFVEFMSGTETPEHDR